MDKTLKDEQLDKYANQIFDYMRIVCNDDIDILISLYYKMQYRLKRLKNKKVYDATIVPIWKEPKKEEMVYPVEDRIAEFNRIMD
jgi:hypothetical protein